MTTPGPADRTPGRPRALVVGGTGFLGRHIVAALAADGWDVTVASRRATTAPAVALPPERPSPGDPSDALRGVLAEALRGLRPALVVNAAGLIWRPDPADMAVANSDVPESVALAMADAGSRARLVHLGSCLEYGPVPPHTAVDERVPAAPATAYGRSKLLGTRRLRAVADGHGLDAVVLRVFNAIGPGMSPASVLGRALRVLLAARADGGRAGLDLLDLRQHRDYVDARDVAEAVVAAATARPGDEWCFNIGSGTARTAAEVVRLLAEASGVPFDLVLRPVTGDGARSAGADWQRADTGLARRALGWTPRRTLPRTLDDIWAAAVRADDHPPDHRAAAGTPSGRAAA
ncbi:NAD(P)-dependent oxidoreductase, partial [Actinomadura logoneensis]